MRIRVPYRWSFLTAELPGGVGGTLGINDAVPSTSNCPFGGVKQSGWGRALGGEGLEAFLETKYVSPGL